ncbi:hypothetical protein CYY_000530 [Polysphondylium violaceum]|uniref:Thioredoxin domain-containing protein n=1 Tax=Polysphondylium violaceum TaxID=133409 RepID=A0A8J4QAS4_9MYCE|nr:hypothetical protein CYY_000530 [Polysphondylium violaceum]
MGLVKKIIVTSPTEFSSAIKEATSLSKVVFVSFISSLDKATCSLWCRDCQISEPVVNEAVEKSNKDIYLVECQIEREGYKGNPDHPYRTDPNIKLTAIPTLFVWTKEQNRLVEEDCADLEKVNKLIDGAF